ncbi:branched-chain amino acid ABC transporter permease [Caenimonas soli]|uniref:branched-chain amino acid ABC transporter permease n=1 Tax=Caenimonas soli TaxID=2735555 RepID=UPI0015576411|nr:branched-chain amino acid ABC transporter permease [Caenimonas soli]NPC59146.1 branched-chain amino acid ABC transporter permease [Caenimonas soli]
MTIDYQLAEPDGLGDPGGTSQRRAFERGLRLDWSALRYAPAVVLGLLLAFLPLVSTGYALTLAVEAMILAIFACGVNVLVGYTGLTTVGNAMFVGLGGYGIAILSKLLGMPLWVAFPLTVVIVALVSVAIGAICTRTRGVEFLLITLAFSQMLYGLAIKLPWTGGSDGMTGIARPDLAWLGLNAEDPVTFYVYVALVLALTVLFLWRMTRSPFGSVLLAIRENERRAISMGYRTSLFKIGSFVISAIICSIAGILRSQYSYFVNPDSMSWQASGEGLLIVIMGGAGTLLGPAVGAALSVLVKDGLSRITGEYNLFFGLFFMLVVVVFRGGVAGALNNLEGRFR